ncbi:MAG: hypothetical protein R3B06_05360 [Kofleriaceae bacterium]
MRLGSCIAVETATLLAALVGVAWGATALSAELRGPGAEPTQDLALRAPPRPTPPPTPPKVAVPVAAVQATRGDVRGPEVALPVAPTVADPLAPRWAFAGRPDEPLLAPLRAGTPTGIKVNRGGTSLSLRIDFDNGARAAFKPDQVFGQSNPRREVAAYRIDRLLGIGRVPPAVAVSYDLEQLLAATGDAEARARLRTDAVPRKGKLRGELSWWVPVLADGYIGSARIDDTVGIVTWRKWLKAGGQIPPERRALCEQLSAMALFDFVIGNIDRWTGNNAKVSEDGQVLYFMDNTLAFGKNRQGAHKTHLYLQRVQTFSKELVGRLRALDEPRLRAVLEPERGDFEQLLTDEEVAAVLSRRDRALEYVDGLIAVHGEAKVLAFP